MSTLRHTLSEYKEGILKNDRIVLAKAITLVESTLPSDLVLAANLIDEILPYTGKAIRIGITGVPGVGKSTFIEAFGRHLIEDHGKTLAVLTIDPSSQITKGSILGDKTRMETLSRNKHAFIRPTAAGESLGGVASRSREVLLLCDAAGFDVIIVETVGVGQSEVMVKSMVDFFLLLMLARAGDELQGIKKGIVEMADAIVITKADGDNIKHAKHAQAEFSQALHYHDRGDRIATSVMTCSTQTGEGLKEIWKVIDKAIQSQKETGALDRNRSNQLISWFSEHFQQLLQTYLHDHESFQNRKAELESQLASKQLSPQTAAHLLLESMREILARDVRSR